MAIPPIILLLTNLFFSLLKFSAAVDTITQSESLLDGTTLISRDGRFELGFFSPGSNSTNHYIGIWYKNIPIRTVVWVANRDKPIKDNSSKLTLTIDGNLVLLNDNNTVIWTTNTTTKKALNSKSNVVVQLLDTGNLVLRDEKDNDPQNYLWQSFDYPSDTLLPGMKLGWDFKAGLNRRLTAWKNWDDPSSGDFTWGIVLTNDPEAVMWKGSKEYYRSGPAIGTIFIGNQSLIHNTVINYTLVSNKDELYFSFRLYDKSVISRIVMNQTGYVRQRMTWSKDTQTWRMSSVLPSDYCDTYNLCGPFGVCVIDNSPFCGCLNGFSPKSPRRWNEMEWSDGCVRSGNWRCGEKNMDGFIKLSNMKVPDTKKSWVNRNITLEECREICRGNCSCTAFANSDLTGEGSGCIIWFDELLDLREMPNSGRDLYVRLAASDIEKQDTKGDSKKKVIIITSTIISIAAAVFIIIILWRIKSDRKVKTGIITETKEKNNESIQEDNELPLFNLESIVHSTDDFSPHNKLGEGGFGPVYRGTLLDGQEIAVKRLSETSKQGLVEFKNEVVLCTKLQHRNLVKVLGCCIEKDEKLLIYEFMANKSLDFFLFSSAQSKLLDWPKRFIIINGIARGLLYLHQDSRLRIIHRDLKASNILLDKDMNPKISDFGLARMCGGDQIEGNTNRVVGTYGYMAPEYAYDGIFSIKSDVFSFGILLLEIISGKRNNKLFSPTKSSLIGNAWRLWKEDIAMQLIDASLEDSCVVQEVLRCIHIGLLCVQQHPNDRPSMASVVVSLSSEGLLPLPKEPRFLIEDVSTEGEFDSEKQTSSSVNDVTISLLSVR